MRQVLKKMKDPKTGVLLAYEKAFKDLKYLFDICNDSMDVSRFRRDLNLN